ncbi:unnamed protein product [Prorocentrum cordatum]|uniref:EF-hand domain-containing protein n=1 Tax=Prorocentrum cordatum TaxID=2364126 RepID=A0ABN9WP03_9DINO|nr:unnamed protein product [Polarella glacialis]
MSLRVSGGPFGPPVGIRASLRSLGAGAPRASDARGSIVAPRGSTRENHGSPLASGGGRGSPMAAAAEAPGGAVGGRSSVAQQQELNHKGQTHTNALQARRRTTPGSLGPLAEPALKGDLVRFDALLTELRREHEGLARRLRGQRAQQPPGGEAPAGRPPAREDRCEAGPHGEGALPVVEDAWAHPCTVQSAWGSGPEPEAQLAGVVFRDPTESLQDRSVRRLGPLGRLLDVVGRRPQVPDQVHGPVPHRFRGRCHQPVFHRWQRCAFRLLKPRGRRTQGERVLLRICFQPDVRTDLVDRHPLEHSDDGPGSAVRRYGRLLPLRPGAIAVDPACQRSMARSGHSVHRHRHGFWSVVHFGVALADCRPPQGAIPRYPGAWWRTWSWIDITAVTFWYIERLSQSTMSLEINPKVIRVARLVKLLRFIRVIRFINAFEKLFSCLCRDTRVITIQFAVDSKLRSQSKASFSALAWSSAVLLLVEIVFALLLNILLEGFWNDADNPMEDRQVIFQHFGTFSKSLLSMFEMLLGNWYSITRELVKVNEWYMVLGVGHQLAFGFAVIEVMTGVFLHETFQVASLDDGIMTNETKRAIQRNTEKMKQFFESADSNGDGFLDKQELEQVLQRARVQEWLSGMGLNIPDVVTAFTVMDENGDGLLSAKDCLWRGHGT